MTRPFGRHCVRMLLAFADSGYLGYSETILEFPHDSQISESLRSVSIWQ